MRTRLRERVSGQLQQQQRFKCAHTSEVDEILVEREAQAVAEKGHEEDR
jgi:hypothetical protein